MRTKESRTQKFLVFQRISFTTAWLVKTEQLCNGDLEWSPLVAIFQAQKNKKSKYKNQQFCETRKLDLKHKGEENKYRKFTGKLLEGIFFSKTSLLSKWSGAQLAIYQALFRCGKSE